MTPRLPMMTAKEIIAVLEKKGFEKIRQKGSHAILYNSISDITVTIPVHTGDLKRGLVQAIIKQSGLKEEDMF